MDRQGFIDHLRKLGWQIERAEAAAGYVESFESFLDEGGHAFEECDVRLLDAYLSKLIEGGSNSVERLIALARYFSFSRRHELFIRLLVILNSYDILPLMERRLEELHGAECRLKVFQDWKVPPLGTAPENYPEWVSTIIGNMENELTPEQCRNVLTWNYHEMPKEAFAKKKARYDSADTIDEFLQTQHKALVDELNECLRAGKVWYEQEVTQKFVDHVTSDQRVQTGLRQGNRIICEKVPYDTKNFYQEADPEKRRYLYCHCPLVRSAIREGGPKVSPMFCHCSAGFEKIAWDTIFDESVEVEVLETVLGGGSKCVFSIGIPKDKMK